VRSLVADVTWLTLIFSFSWKFSARTPWWDLALNAGRVEHLTHPALRDFLDRSPELLQDRRIWDRLVGLYTFLWCGSNADRMTWRMSHQIRLDNRDNWFRTVSSLAVSSLPKALRNRCTSTLTKFQYSSRSVVCCMRESATASKETWSARNRCSRSCSCKPWANSLSKDFDNSSFPVRFRI